MIEGCKRALPLTESAPAIIVVVTGNPSIVSLHYSQPPGLGFGDTQSTSKVPEAAGGAVGET